MKKALGVLSAILILCLAMTCISFATNAEKQENITYRSIKIVVDGVQISPADVTGASTEPFILNSEGSTYLPIRAVANALGLTVDWDEATSKVILKTGGEKINGTTVPSQTNKAVKATLYYRDITITLDGGQVILQNAIGKAVEPFIYNNSTYIPLRAVASALGADVSWDDGTSTVTITTAEIPDAFAVKTQPADVKVLESESAQAAFEVAAVNGAAPYTYQWQYSNDEGKTWTNSNVSTSRTEKLVLTSVEYALNGNLYRCVITDAANKSVTSDSAKLTVDPKLQIKDQPKDVDTAQEGEFAYFKVEVIGGTEPYTYLWTQSKDGGNTWATCSDAYTVTGVNTANSATLIVKIDEEKSGHVYRCTVKDATGKEVTSIGATYTYVPIKYDLYISHNTILGTITYAALIAEIARDSEEKYTAIQIASMLSKNTTIKFTGLPKDAAEEYVQRFEEAHAKVTKVVSGTPVDIDGGDVVAPATYKIIFLDKNFSRLERLALIPVVQVVGGMSLTEARAFLDDETALEITGISERNINNYVRLLKLAGAEVTSAVEAPAEA